mgnify:CR=1 FL=1
MSTEDMNCSFASVNSSFHNVMSTPKKRPKTDRIVKPAMNSRATVMIKDLFTKAVVSESATSSNKSSVSAATSVQTCKSRNQTCAKNGTAGPAVLMNKNIRENVMCVMSMYMRRCVGLTAEDRDLFVCLKCEKKLTILLYSGFGLKTVTI